MVSNYNDCMIRIFFTCLTSGYVSNIFPVSIQLHVLLLNCVSNQVFSSVSEKNEGTRCFQYKKLNTAYWFVFWLTESTKPLTECGLQLHLYKIFHEPFWPFICNFPAFVFWLENSSTVKFILLFYFQFQCKFIVF